jgi:hypothetical protein
MADLTEQAPSFPMRCYSNTDRPRHLTHRWSAFDMLHRHQATRAPERIMVAHPFHPVHLCPLVPATLPVPWVIDMFP